MDEINDALMVSHPKWLRQIEQDRPGHLYPRSHHHTYSFSRPHLTPHDTFSFASSDM